MEADHAMTVRSVVEGFQLPEVCAMAASATFPALGEAVAVCPAASSSPGHSAY